MDFYRIKQHATKNGIIEVYPDFTVGRTKDLMVRGGGFYAIWDEANSIWSTDEYDVQKFVDESLWEYKNDIKDRAHGTVVVKTMRDFSNRTWSEFRAYMKNISDNAHELDMELTFSNTEVKQEDYRSKRLPYPLQEGSIDAFDRIIGTLYSPEERAKLEWAIGAVVAGDAKDIQKFIVLYGEAGSGKSTMLEIIQKLFQGYYTTFEAKALTSSGNAFSTEVFKDNPLVAIQHDGDLSRIEDNTKLNSIVSHELMTMNEKYKPSYMARVNAFLFMATNKPVRITDAKSGIIRRLIDVKPTNNLIPPGEYQTLMTQIDFELGAIAHHCLNVYRKMGKLYYSNYKPIDMMYKTDVFFNYMEEHYHLFKEQDGTSLRQAYDLYKLYCDDSSIDFVMPRHKFREEIKSYFANYEDRTRDTYDGSQMRNYYSGFLTDKFTNKYQEEEEEEHQYSLVLDHTESLFDIHAHERPAQYATKDEIPTMAWDDVTTTLNDIDTGEVHYVRPDIQHIVIDFDLTNEHGEKDLEMNIAAASRWPATYAEISKGGQGIHLHYIYEGDVEQLSRVYSDDIEIKVFTGKSSLRRRLTKCNNVPISTISSGLPTKGDTKVINHKTVQSEKSLRDLIMRNIHKEFHPGTKPSVDFIHKILQDAYDSDLVYDVSDMRPKVMAFANNSTNQANACLKLVADMKFQSEKEYENIQLYSDDKIAFFDVEVYPNLFVIVWKYQGGEKVVMINPTPEEVAPLLDIMLVGFNCRRYDNHILYARHLGYTNEQLYYLSQQIIGNNRDVLFREAYNLSYTDIYDYASKKQSLAKWQVELGLIHDEMEIPWDQPVPEELWPRVVEYCGNDVDSTEAVFEATQADYMARVILSEVSGLTPNDSTQRHTAKIIFGNDKNFKEHFVYTDLSEEFPGYSFDYGKSSYRGEDPKEGGYVYAEPGIYNNVVLLDIASMHPTSAIHMNIFGKYTKRYKELMDARLAIKHNDIPLAETYLDGVLKPFLKDEKMFEDLSYALKIVINIVYGLTSAKFDNPFRDIRNIDNIVAKRGSLFMIDLKHAVWEKGYSVAHIKTDSIKIPNADQDIIDFVFEFGKKYGYTFEHEMTFDRFALVNESVYVGKIGWADKERLIGTWDAVGAQYQHPYIFKKLFTHDPITKEDMVETKATVTTLYLDMNEGLEDGEHQYEFIGKVGNFTPVKPGCGGGQLMREKDGKYYAVTGTKGYRWLPSDRVTDDIIDLEYYREMTDKAMDNIAKFGDPEMFIE